MKIIYFCYIFTFKSYCVINCVFIPPTNQNVCLVGLELTWKWHAGSWDSRVELGEAGMTVSPGCLNHVCSWKLQPVEAQRQPCRSVLGLPGNLALGFVVSRCPQDLYIFQPYMFFYLFRVGT